jgi:hypothetical protein
VNIGWALFQYSTANNTKRGVIIGYTRHKECLGYVWCPNCNTSETFRRPVSDKIKGQVPEMWLWSYDETRSLWKNYHERCRENILRTCPVSPVSSAINTWLKKITIEKIAIKISAPFSRIRIWIRIDFRNNDRLF